MASARHPRVVGLLLAVALLATPLAAAADLEEQVRVIGAELRCPVCQNLSVAESPSELAVEMRGVIKAQLQAGKTPDEVKAYFVEKYGDWILLSPRMRGLNVLVWLGPFVAAGAGLALALLSLRRWVRRGRMARCSPADPALLELVRREAAVEPERDATGPELSALELERESLYAALRELEFDRRAGKLSPRDYEELREDYEVRAANVFTELEHAMFATAPVESPTGLAETPMRAEPGRPSRRDRRRARLVAAAAFLLLFGLAAGYSLTHALRPRLSDRDSVTGDPLTGTTRVTGTDVASLLIAAQAAFQRQDLPAATDAVERALVIDKSNPEAHGMRALLLLHQGRTDEALRAADTALMASPDQPLALWAKGSVLYEVKHDYAGAIRVWETLLALPLNEEDTNQVAQLVTTARQRLGASRASTR